MFIMCGTFKVLNNILLSKQISKHLAWKGNEKFVFPLGIYFTQEI